MLCACMYAQTLLCIHLQHTVPIRSLNEAISFNFIVFSYSQDIHDRLVYGSDYPVPAINLVVHTSKLKRLAAHNATYSCQVTALLKLTFNLCYIVLVNVYPGYRTQAVLFLTILVISYYRVGLITPAQCTALNELYNYNPLLFDLVSKRLLRGPKGGSFPSSLFKAHPQLPPYRTVTKNPKLSRQGTSVDPCVEQPLVNKDSENGCDVNEESVEIGEDSFITRQDGTDKELAKDCSVQTQVQVEMHQDTLQDVESERGSDQFGVADSKVQETVEDCITDSHQVHTDQTSNTNKDEIDESVGTVTHNHETIDTCTVVEEQSMDHMLQDSDHMVPLSDESETTVVVHVQSVAIDGGSTSNSEVTADAV